jgi:hypothetical protein
MKGYLETQIGFDAIKVTPAFESSAQSECRLNGW